MQGLIRCPLLVLALVAPGLSGADYPERARDGSPFIPVTGVVVSVRTADFRLTLRPLRWSGPLRLHTHEYVVANRLVISSLNPGDRVQGWYSSRDGKLHRVRTIARGASGSLAANRTTRLSD